MPTRALIGLTAFAAWLGSACPEGEPPNDAVADGATDSPVPDAGADTGGWPPLPDATAIAGTQVRMDFTRVGGFYTAPFPSEDLRGADGRADVSGFPNPGAVDFVADVVAVLARDVAGFGQTSAVFLRLDGGLDPASLPADVHASLAEDASVTLVDVDPGSPGRGQRHPAEVAFLADPGPFGAPDLLSVLPYQGLPLRPATLYAAVVRRSAQDEAGQALGVSESMARLLAGDAPEGLVGAALDDYRTALAEVVRAGVPPDDVAGLAVFRTDDSSTVLDDFYDHLRASVVPQPSAPFEAAEVFDDFCVFATTIPMPTYQHGEPPYISEGGGWKVDEAGVPVLAGHEEASLVVTIPRAPAPPAGYPFVSFIRTGGGGDRPLVDRGVQGEPGGPALEPGSGPARDFAQVGFAGVSIDGPHGGLRNVSGSDEQFLVFNVTNPEALRDNVRQSAIEVGLWLDVLAGLSVDVSGCGGATSPATFDIGTAAVMGHSMGASIAPLTLAVEPRYRAVLLSGAGGSWNANVMHKQSPVVVKPLAELLLEYGERQLHPHDPALNLVQWAGEPADVPIFGARITGPERGGPPPHVLMLQGIVDTYIPPPVANAMSLPLGLDLAGDALDEVHPDLQHVAGLASLLPLTGRAVLPLPVQANRVGPAGESLTTVVVQHPEDGVQDGHEVAFQTEPPKLQYRCFLAHLAAGVTPVVPDPAAGCPALP